ncbi:inorganic phosphate transporter Pho88 [Phycomyces nitens]|nr:inorganic phosphate transporter Pho88 [Phycomyces nitens]
MPNWNKILNHPLFNVGFFLVTRQITKQFNLDNYIWFLRALYIGVQLTILGMSYYLITVVKKKNGKSNQTVEVVQLTLVLFLDKTVLRYVEPAKQNWDGTDAPEQLVNITVRDYDVEEIKKAIKQSLMGIAMIIVLHLKFHYVQPLIIQSILGLKTFLMTKEARIHIWGERTTTGELKRPFRITSPFGLNNEKMQPKVDQGSIKKAEKARKAA